MQGGGSLHPEFNLPSVLQLTKIFRFETAHAIHRYEGKCRDIHGHSYELHVSISGKPGGDEYIVAGNGFVMDFKELKKIVGNAVIDLFDHKVILSVNYLAEHPELQSLANLITWDFEPSAENMLINIRKNIEPLLPGSVRLTGLRLYETTDSYAEWQSG